LELRGKGALIVGAKRIGQVIANRLADEGIDIAIGYRNSKKEAQRLHDDLSSKNVKVFLIQGDLTVEEEVRFMVKQAATQLGNLSFVINLASGFPRTPMENLDGTAWDASMSDAKGNYLLVVHASRIMKSNPTPIRGHIVLFSDAWVGETPYRNHVPYLTSKAATDFLVRVFAVELAPESILVNAIAPGPTMRPPDMSEDVWKTQILTRTPLNRESSTDDIAEIIVALLRSTSITGETIRVDAGVHLAGPEPKHTDG